MAVMTTEFSSTSSRRTPRTYAWVIAILGIVLALGSTILYLFEKSWVFESQIGVGLGGLLLLGAVLLRPDSVRAFFTGRSVKYGSNALISSVAFIGILGLINFLSYKYEFEYDLTETGRFTLSQQTIKTLETLDEPVQVVGFFQTGDPRIGRAREYLERYSLYTPYLTYEFHDPNIEPALAQSFDLTNYGLVFVSSHGRHESAGVDEQSITSGLIRVSRDQPRNVYFLAGHGEHRLDDTTEEGYSALKQALERDNYQVSSLNLSSGQGAVPEDATVLIMAGADRELPEVEARVIADWVADGGKLMILIDPQEPVPLAPLLQTFGLFVDDGFVVEDMNNALVTLGPEGLTPQVLAPLVTHYPYHEITNSLKGYQSFYPYARSMTLIPTQDYSKNVAPILSTSPGSWLETDPQAAQPEFDDGVDLRGPLHIGAAAENSQNEARLVVIGDAGFVTNQNASPQMANLDLFLNAVNWLTEEEALISIRPKQPENRQLFLTATQVNMTLLTSVIIIPLAVFTVGLGVWWKRR
jgi:ABC-type uncharacterized transport system involved in gliding motility auxiliary subunit